MNYDELNELLKKYSDLRNSKDKNNSKSNDKNSKESSSNKFDYGFFYTNENGFGCNDMPGGFQRINPLLFIVIGDIMGDLISGKLPFNVQNAVGNWIQLVGQAIETYSSQQQYFQSGPGRYYSPENLNITNSTCPYASSKTSSVSSSESSSNNNDNINNTEEIITGFYTVIKELRDELDDVKRKIDIIGKDILTDNSNNIE